MIRKVKKHVKDSKGFLTKEGSVINYEEVHALGLGIIDGVGLAEQGYRLEYWLETHDDVNQGTMHYYDLGYNISRALKYIITLGVLSHFFGAEALKLLVA